MLIRIFSSSKKHEKFGNYSHGCLTDFPDCLSVNNPINHTETKAKDVNPKKIST